MDLEVVNITTGRKDLLPLLTQAYNDVYLPAFQNSETRESLEKIIATLGGKYPSVDITINILGQNLTDPDPAKHIIKGISVAYYYKEQNVGLLAYNAISPHHREKGLGKIMVQSRIESLEKIAQSHGKTLAGVFAECNDPSKVPRESDSMDPQKRVDIFKQWGARQIPIDYVQPPVSSDGYYNENLIIMNYPVSGKYASKPAIEDFLRAVYCDFRLEVLEDAGKTATAPVLAEDDHFFCEMKKQLDNIEWKEDSLTSKPGYAVNAPKFRFFG